MKTSFFKQIFFAVIFQVLLAASLFSQKYENGTRLLKGAEVLSATPLQLDYVLEKLADTAKITVNLHEGKTHLVLNDGSGKWREWWYCEGRWKLKNPGALPEGLEGSIQTKSGNNFKGSKLGINDVYINSLATSNVGIINNNAYLQVTPQGQAEHRQANNLWNFRSSLADTTLYLRNRINFEQSPDILLNINSYPIGAMKLISKAKTNVRNSQIGISYSNGVNLFSQDADATSQIDVVNFKGISIVNKWPSTNTVNDLTINWQKTNFAWQNNTKSREFSLNEESMVFQTNQGATLKSRFIVADTRYDYVTENVSFSMDGNSFIYRSKKYGTGEFFTYQPGSNRLNIKNAIYFITDDYLNLPSISLTNDKDIKFTREELPAISITLTEIIQKGQIIKQAAEPTIPNDSFAFWVDGSNFYLILNSSGVQKKIQLQ